jgi:DNA-binding transcriptional ArsR family regulator
MTGGEVSVGFLAEALRESQPKISRHLAYLRAAGLVSTRREGKWIYYGIASPAESAVGTVLNATLCAMSGADVVHMLREPGRFVDHEDPYESEDTSEDAYTNDWQPAEIEVFLL